MSDSSVIIRDAGHDPGHIPVMLPEVLEYLRPESGEIHIDGTFGGGGYTRAILASAECQVLGVDRDPAAIERGNRLSEELGPLPSSMPRLTMLHGPFGTMYQLAEAAGFTSVNGVVLDLGVSSFQIDEAERGFSFRMDGPLDMRMSSSGRSAADLIANATESELADIFHFYGEERYARRVARAVVSARTTTAVETTLQLAEIIRSAVPADRSGIDPATRSFQGLRIAVNDELDEIHRGIEAGLKLLAPGGRMVVVSFHSLEDRIVKQAFATAAGAVPGPSRHNPGAMLNRSAPPSFKLLSRKAIRPSDDECRRNPRARSARLRAIVRTENVPPHHSSEKDISR